MSVKVAYYVGSQIYYLTPLVTGVTWSGDTTTASRSCQISLNNTTDGYTREVNVEVGRDVRLLKSSGEELFRGVIFDSEITSDGAQRITVRDYNHYLVKNTDSHVFKNKKASDIVRYICSAYGIKGGQIDDTGYVIPKLVLRDKTIYDMIIIALTETRKKTGKIYLLGNEKGLLTLRERKNQVKRLVIQDSANLISASQTESIEDLRNSVRYTGKSGDDAVGVSVSDNASISRYGLMREKKTESDATDAQLKPIAQALLNELNKVSTESTVEAIGDTSVRAGSMVQVSEQMSGIRGGFVVITDDHTFEPSGKHTMRLKVSKTLEFTEIEYEPPEEPKPATAASVGDIPADGGGTFMRPASGAISSGYGRRGSGMHYGIDIAAKGKVPIVAAADGSVTRSYYSSSYGEAIILRHSIGGKTYETVYAHMRKGSRTVKTGATVKRGQVLGYMGNTGDSDGQHLHFEIHSPTWNSAKSNALNPANYI